MKLILRDAKNGFIIDVDPEIAMTMDPSNPFYSMATKVESHVFKDVEEVVTFIRDFYAKRPNKNTPPREP